jgi:hypothetical protein
MQHFMSKQRSLADAPFLNHLSFYFMYFYFFFHTLLLLRYLISLHYDCHAYLLCCFWLSVIVF